MDTGSLIMIQTIVIGLNTIVLLGIANTSIRWMMKVETNKNKY